MDLQLCSFMWVTLQYVLLLFHYIIAVCFMYVALCRVLIFFCFFFLNLFALCLFFLLYVLL